MGAIQRCIAEILAKAKEFREAFGDEPRARSLEWAAARVEQTVRDESDELLTLAQASKHRKTTAAHSRSSSSETVASIHATGAT